MQIAEFAHPFNDATTVLVCGAAHVSPAVLARVVRLALREERQVLLVGQQFPEVLAVTGTPAAGLTPEGLRADVVTVPGVRYALAHIRATPRSVFVVHVAPDVLAAYAQVLRRPGRPDRSPRPEQPVARAV